MSALFLSNFVRTMTPEISSGKVLPPYEVPYTAPFKEVQILDVESEEDGEEMGGGGQGGLGSSSVGNRRRLKTIDIENMYDLFNSVSGGDISLIGGQCSTCIVGNTIMSNDDRVKLIVKTYQCVAGKTCSSGDSMLFSNDRSGSVVCANDSADCVIDGQSTRRGLRVDGDGSKTLTLRALTFYNGHAVEGGGIYNSGNTVNVVLCVFKSCTGTQILYGGGGIYTSRDVKIYATRFEDNSSDGGDGNDIIRDGSPGQGSVIVYDTCPSPYEANTPTKGKARTTRSLY